MRLFTRLIILIPLGLMLLFSSCKKKQQAASDLQQIIESGELNVLTLNVSTSYFIYREDTIGYNFEMARNFCDSIGVKLNIIVAENEKRLIELLNNGVGDLIAYPIFMTNEMKGSLIYCGPQQINHQVLVQQANRNDTILTNQTQLIGKTIYTLQDSKYYERLLNFNNEIGGGIHIECVDKDTITTEDLIGMVSGGNIRYTLADNDLAKLNKTYYNNINISLPMSFDQRSSWAVRSNTPLLAKALDKWIKQYDKTPSFKSTVKKYFELSKQPLSADFELPKGLSKNAISPYDSLFQKYTQDSNFSWQLLAAVSYHESRFRNNLTSWAGAAGIMGLMPRTAKSLGLSSEERMNPALSIKAAVQLFDRLDVIFKMIKDKNERIKFILAAYNGGDGHIRDAMRLASKYGADPYKWDENVRKFALLKSNPEYYKDPVCKNGYFRGKETVTYVDNVLKTASRFAKGK